MLTFEVKGKEYKVQYNYRAFATTDILDKLAGMTEGAIQDTILTEAELLLIGLAKHHPEFKFDTKKEHDEKLDMVFDIMDEYDEENEEGCFKLLELINEELMASRFLLRMTAQTPKKAVPKSKKL